MADGCADSHAVSTLEVSDGTRRDITDAALEGDVPLLTCASGPDDLECERHVGTCFTRTLERYELAHRRCLSPMDVARILSFA